MKKKHILAILCWLLTLPLWGIVPPTLQCINIKSKYDFKKKIRMVPAKVFIGNTVISSSEIISMK